MPPDGYDSPPLAVTVPPGKGIWLITLMTLAGLAGSPWVLRADRRAFGIIAIGWALMGAHALWTIRRTFTAVGEGWVLRRSTWRTRTTSYDDISAAWLAETIGDQPAGLRLATPQGMLRISSRELDQPVGAIVMGQLLQHGTPIGRRLLVRAVRTTPPEIATPTTPDPP